MSAKDKVSELIEKFNSCLPSYDAWNGRKCAQITVQEIINTYEEGDFELIFWKEVKQMLDDGGK